VTQNSPFLPSTTRRGLYIVTQNSPFLPSMTRGLDRCCGGGIRRRSAAGASSSLPSCLILTLSAGFFFCGPPPYMYTVQWRNVVLKSRVYQFRKKNMEIGSGTLPTRGCGEGPLLSSLAGSGASHQPRMKMVLM